MPRYGQNTELERLKKLLKCYAEKACQDGPGGTSGPGGTGIDEAPTDGYLYGRKLRAWHRILHNEFPDLQGGDPAADEFYHLTREQWEALGSSPSNLVFTEDFIVNLSGGKSLGKYVNGDTVPATGLTANEVILLAAIETLYPAFTNPSLAISGSVNGVREVGETVTNALTLTFNRGEIKGKTVSGIWNPNTKQDDRAGAAYEYLFNGVSNGVSNTKSVVLPITLGSNTFTGEVKYLEGPQPIDSEGVNYGSPYPTGQLTSSTSLTGAYKRFFGAADVVTNPRSLSFVFDNLPLSSTFDLLSGTTQRNFNVYLPLGRVIDNVVSVEASNADITSEYVLQGTVQIPDAGGTNRSYNYYKMTTDAPYSATNTHKIKVKNG